MYLAQMHMLPAEVESEFKAGNFVVKDSNQPFNQVDPDHSQEWLNGTGKKGGGIIGITKTTYLHSAGGLCPIIYEASYLYRLAKYSCANKTMSTNIMSQAQLG